MEKEKERSRFTGSLGYVLATAGSAVGLGNIWRFPYLAAKYGGGIFLLVYIVLVLVFGFAMIVSETALGRMTRKSPIGAFRSETQSKALRFGGILNAVVPILIAPYYAAIGGWVTKYCFVYLKGDVQQAATDGYFSNFIASSGESEIWFLVFMLTTLLVILFGVKGGVEKVSKVMMPLLIVLALFVAIFSMTRPGAGAGIKYVLVPNFKDFSWRTVVAAMEQMFYSLSIAMGILVTYGSYMPKEVDIEKSTSRVAFVDTAIAIVATLIIIPAVFAYDSPATLKAGPSLMFITIPKIFANMSFGRWVGVGFFLMVLFAALTSSISLVETGVSTIEDETGLSRKKSTLVMGALCIAIGTASALGFGVWSSVKLIGMDILDFLDFLTNSLMMPIAAFTTCLLVVKAIGLKNIEAEVQLSSQFKRKKLYEVSISYITPICIIVVFIASVLSVFGVIAM